MFSRATAVLSSLLDMAHGVLPGGDFAITMIIRCTTPEVPAHWLIGDDDAHVVEATAKWIDEAQKRVGGISGVVTAGEGLVELDERPAPELGPDPTAQIREVLTECVETFRRYEDHHRRVANGWDQMGGEPSKQIRTEAKDQRLEKAEANREMAEKCERILGCLP